MVSLTCLAGCQAPRSSQRDFRTIRVTDLDGYVEFVARQREHRQKSKLRAEKSRFEETIIEERLSLETEGYVYHPNLFEFALSGLFGLLQYDYESLFGGRTQSDSDAGTVMEFNLDGQFLKKKSYPAWIHARRYRTLEPRPFQSTLETTTTNYGLAWRYVSEKTPTSIRFDYTDVGLDPLGDLEEDSRRTDTDYRFDTAYRFDNHNILSLEYGHESHAEQPRRLDYDADEVTLRHHWDFGRGNRNRLESDLNYRDQRGTLGLERLRWRETLRLVHSDALRSRYQLEALDRTLGSLADIPDIQERSFYLSASVEHRLYESLVSQLTGFVQTQSFDSGIEIDRVGALLSFNYRKKNRWGILLGDYTFRLVREDREGPSQANERLDEEHAFRDPEAVTLTNPRINIGSIVITAEDRVTVYRESRDYTVHTVGDRIEIRRVPTGRIADGQTVLVGYVFEFGRTFKLDTINQRFSLRQRFGLGLSPYYELRRQVQDISPEGGSGITPEDITAHTFGLEFRRGPLALLAEYETQDSTITPFDAVRLSADYNRRFRFGATAGLAARWTDIDYEPPNERKITLFTLEGRYRHPITNRLAVEGTVLYRNEKDSLSRNNEGIDLDLSVEWFIRRTEIRVTYEYSDFEDDFARNRTSRLYIQARRRF